MGNVPLAASRLRLPRFQGPLDQYRKLVSLRSLMQGEQMNALQIEKAQREKQTAARAQQQQQAAADLDRQVDELIANAEGDARSVLPQIRKLSPEHWKQYKNWFADFDSKDAKAQIEAIKLGMKKTDRMAELAQGVTDQASRNSAIQQGPREGLLDKATAQRWLSMPYDPAKIKAIQNQALTTAQFYTHEENRVNAAETERHNRAMEGKPPASEAAFQAFYKPWLESKGLERRADYELKARKEFRAHYQPRGTTPKPPSASGKALAERTKQRAMQRAEDAYRKKIAKLKEWQPDSMSDPGLFYNQRGESMNLSEYMALKKLAEDERAADQELAEESYADQLEALGFDPGEASDPRSPADVRQVGAAPQPGGGDRVTVISPQGVRGSIPRSQLQQALREGYTVQQ